MQSSRKIAVLWAICAIMSVSSSAAQADELYIGGSAHSVDTPFSLDANEGGSDIQAGWRSEPIAALSAILSPSAYVHGQVSLKGETNMAAMGLVWSFGTKIYVKPSFGLAIHDGKIPQYRSDGWRTDFGSRVLFNPNIAVGTKLNDRLGVELSWEHISNGTIFSKQNVGMDFLGARLVFKLD